MQQMPSMVPHSPIGSPLAYLYIMISPVSQSRSQTDIVDTMADRDRVDFEM